MQGLLSTGPTLSSYQYKHIIFDPHIDPWGGGGGMLQKKTFRGGDGGDGDNDGGDNNNDGKRGGGEFFGQKKMLSAPNKKYQCHYPHRSRELMSPLCGIFLG